LVCTKQARYPTGTLSLSFVHHTHTIRTRYVHHRYTIRTRYKYACHTLDAGQLRYRHSLRPKACRGIEAASRRLSLETPKVGRTWWQEHAPAPSFWHPQSYSAHAKKRKGGPIPRKGRPNPNQPL
jgi:hypothetical protein